MRKIFITDFDGTITKYDFYRVALAELIPPGIPDYWEMYLSGKLSHFDVLNKMFSHISASTETVLAAVDKMQFDPQTTAATAKLRAAGWEIQIASAGCEWYIRYLLANHGVDIPVNANPGSYSPETGLVMTPPTTSPYYTTATGIDKNAIMQNALATANIVAFAGDGPPDYPPALAIPANYRFATGWLAEKLTTENVPFNYFERWSEIADVLVN